MRRMEKGPFKAQLASLFPHPLPVSRTPPLLHCAGARSARHSSACSSPPAPPPPAPPPPRKAGRGGSARTRGRRRSSPPPLLELAASAAAAPGARGPRARRRPLDLAAAGPGAGEGGAVRPHRDLRPPRGPSTPIGEAEPP